MRTVHDVLIDAIMFANEIEHSTGDNELDKRAAKTVAELEKLLQFMNKRGYLSISMEDV